MSLANSIIYGDESSVLFQLQNGADVNEVDEYGFRPLIESAIANKPKIGSLLLQHGAEVDQEDSTGRTALHWAVENNNIPFCQLLLSHGANPNHYTRAAQPLLVSPLLRRQSKLKNLLYDARADLNFALDYINSKLLGHRYELTGIVDIVSHQGKFIELDFEGFFLEFTIDIILQSLDRYRQNFGSRHLRKYFYLIRNIVSAFHTAATLIKYQQYLINVEHYANQLDPLLSQDVLIVPVAHHGHAITFIKFYDLWVKCDRGENSLSEGSVNVYKVNNLRNFNKKLFKELIYVRQDKKMIQSGFKKILNTTLLHHFPLPPQITGNCSWSNVEAAIPVLLFLYLLEQENMNRSPEMIKTAIESSLHFYHQWCNWDKDRALFECLQSFENASPARKASKASILGAILFQSCKADDPDSLVRAEKILKILSDKKYRYILNSYVDIYYRRSKTIAGENFIHLLDNCGISWY